MRSCIPLLRSYCTPLLFKATPLFLAAATTGGGGNGGASRQTKRKKSGSIPRGQKRATSLAGGGGGGSLATFLPAIAATWMAASSNKMLQPHHVTPDSRKLVWWCCPSCQHQFTKRIDLHVAAGGECPKCHTKPQSLPKTSHLSTGGSSAKGAADGAQLPVKAVAHRCRPSSSQATLAAENANRIKKSVADGSYLRKCDKRNLMPMLAKNYDKEGSKIGEDEIIAVSPKLDGIRCVAAYDAAAKKIRFFSRAGTLFECCDAKIEPYLQSLFEADPTLVLDGELYNDSANLHRMGELLHPTRAGAKSGTSATNKEMIALLAEQIAHVNPYLPKGGLTTAPTASSAGKKQADRSRKGSEAAEGADEIVSFDQLTSAIRATRDRRTPQHEALQRKLQYHIFDLLYCAPYPTEKDSQPFRVRYDYLAKLLSRAHEQNMQNGAKQRLHAFPHALPYDPRVLRLVPSVFCTKSMVDGFLRAAMAVGYEGVMVRRDGLKAADGMLTLPGGKAAKASETGTQSNTDASATQLVHDAQVKVHDSLTDGAQPLASAKRSGRATAGGYGYGQRSSTLLKYKVMQDAEFVIVSAIEGKGKWVGCLGAFVCQTPDRKKTFTVTPASTDAQKRKMWANWEKEYKGKALTVQYQELTNDGIPRFPVGKGIRGAANGRDWI